MDNSTMIETIRELLLAGDSVSDNAIIYYIGLVKKRIKAKCEASIYPIDMDEITIDIVVSYINRRGKEGYSNESEGEVSVSLMADLFTPYTDDFEAYKKSQGAGKLRFI